METIPDKPDRSMFSQERYQFFLDAPFEIGQQCCRVMKKDPANRYAKETGRHPITAMMASESRLRTQKWLKQGCNAFDAKKPTSMPMSFWFEQDVLQYIHIYGDQMIADRKSAFVKSHPDMTEAELEKVFSEKEWQSPICSVYGDVVIDYKGMGQLEGQMRLDDLSPDFGIFELERPLFKTTGYGRTGCMFCGFGCHLEKPGEGRFERMKVTHPKQYEYIMKPKEEGGLGYKEVIDWINEHGNMNIRY